MVGDVVLKLETEERRRRKRENDKKIEKEIIRRRVVQGRGDRKMRTEMVGEKRKEQRSWQ